MNHDWKHGLVSSPVCEKRDKEKVRVGQRLWEEVSYFATACFYTVVKMFNYIACWLKFVVVPEIKFSEWRLSNCLFIKTQASCGWKCLTKTWTLWGKPCWTLIPQGTMWRFPLLHSLHQWEWHHFLLWLFTLLAILKVKLWTRVLSIGSLRVWDSFTFGPNSE